MFNIGDICETTYDFYQYKSKLLRITNKDNNNYYYTFDDENIESCHKNSVIGRSFSLIMSNTKSLKDAKQDYPEYFI